MKVIGVDFTSAPRRAKPITVAHGIFLGAALQIEAIESIESFGSFESLLRRPGPWIGGFDLPFGLPRELVRDLGWPRDWRKLVDFCGNLSRSEWRGILDGYRATRPVGGKYAHRATDHPAGSSSPMKLVNPPVALMFHEGAPRLAESGVHIPGLATGDRSRIALEAYPGLFARSITRESYKNDSPSKQTLARATARQAIASALPVAMPKRLRQDLVDDATGDSLDAVICAVQATWGWQRRRRNFGLPARTDPVEGWIVSAR
ncbi:MAG: DUF429 domain-containing protein [Betaproteobacteria bacterium]